MEQSWTAITPVSYSGNKWFEFGYRTDYQRMRFFSGFSTSVGAGMA
jgi:hypothetical protein